MEVPGAICSGLFLHISGVNTYRLVQSPSNEPDASHYLGQISAMDLKPLVEYAFSITDDGETARLDCTDKNNSYMDGSIAFFFMS